MKNKTAARKTSGELDISTCNFQTIGEASDLILNNLEKNCSGPKLEPLLDIFPDAGLQPGALTVVCSMPSIGKTAYLANVALGLVKKGKNVAVFLPDSTPGEFIYTAAAVNPGDFRNKVCRYPGPKSLFNEFRTAAGQLPRTGLYLSKRSILDLGQIERDSEYLASELKAHGRRLDAVIVDSLSYMKDDEYLEGTFGYLSEVAKKLQTSFICSFGLRPTERTSEGLVRLADIRAAGVDDSCTSLVLYLHRPEYYDRTDPTLKNKARLRFMYSKDTLPLRDYDLEFEHESLRFKKPVYGVVMREEQIFKTM